MKSMGDPDYVYRPWSKERREKARMAALQRLGAPPGFHMIFGVPVAEPIWKDIRDIACRFHYVGNSKRTGSRKTEPIWKTRGLIIFCIDLLSNNPYRTYDPDDDHTVVGGQP